MLIYYGSALEKKLVVDTKLFIYFKRVVWGSIRVTIQLELRVPVPVAKFPPYADCSVFFR